MVTLGESALPNVILVAALIAPDADTATVGFVLLDGHLTRLPSEAPVLQRLATALQLLEQLAQKAGPVPETHSLRAVQAVLEASLQEIAVAVALPPPRQRGLR